VRAGRGQGSLLTALFQRLLPPRCELAVDKASFPWFRDPDVPNFAAARAATVRVHGIEPDMTREGGSIPITQVPLESRWRAVGEPLESRWRAGREPLDSRWRAGREPLGGR
jgi:hypothetical protein